MSSKTVKCSFIWLYNFCELRRRAVVSMLLCALIKFHKIIPFIVKLSCLDLRYKCLVYLQSLGSTCTANHVRYDRAKKKRPSWVNITTINPHQSLLLWFVTPSCSRRVRSKSSSTSSGKGFGSGSEQPRFRLLCNHACDCTGILSPRNLSWLDSGYCVRLVKQIRALRSQTSFN